jgi:hypothetical protein
MLFSTHPILLQPGPISLEHRPQHHDQEKHQSSQPIYQQRLEEGRTLNSWAQVLVGLRGVPVVWYIALNAGKLAMIAAAATMSWWIGGLPK